MATPIPAKAVLEFTPRPRTLPVAVVSVSADGEAIGTQWSCNGADVTSLIGKLTVLTHDLMAARK